MRIRIRKVLFLTLCLFLFSTILCSTVFADDSAEFDEGFTVHSWNSDIKIDENDCYHVIETIDASFIEDRHGIYRTIPTKGTLERDGKSSKYRAKVKNISVKSTNDTNKSTTIPFEVSRKSSAVTIKIGDPDEYAEMYTRYTISYDYDFGGDRLKDGDEAFFNIIGDSWASDISYMSFSVKFPKPINEDKCGVVKGSSDRIPISYDMYSDTLHCNVGSVSYATPVTFRAVLPENYFEEAPMFFGLVPDFDDLSSGDFLSSILSTILLPIIGFIFLIFCIIRFIFTRSKKEEIYEPITVTPPRKDGHELCSYEMSAIYVDRATNQSVLSILFDLANDGYISMEKIKRKNYMFIKEAEYDGADSIKSEFIRALFSRGSVDESGRIVVTTDDLKNSFYTDIDNMQRSIESMYSAEELYTTDSYRESNKYSKLYTAVILIGFIFFIGSPIIGDPLSLIIFGIMLSLGGIILSWSSKNKRLLKDSYRDLRGQIGGFKKFLENAEKPRLEMLIEENPNYFYDTLAYAYALDVTDKYAKNFENINVEPPRYYRSTDDFVLGTFVSDLNDGLSVMSMSPSSDGGGSFSGGSGGGGGGGGSW